MSTSTHCASTLGVLHELAELSENGSNVVRLVFDELKRLGFKPKKVDCGVTVDIGRGKRRLAFFSDASALQSAILLAAIERTDYPTIPLRFVFGASGEGSVREQGLLDGVVEAYAFKPCEELEVGKLGYCYGAACAGQAVFVSRPTCAEKLDAETAEKAALYVTNVGKRSASECGVSLDVDKASDGETVYTARYFDQAKGERVIMELELAALASDDMFGATHDTAIEFVCPPVINHALSVDKARAAAGDDAVEVEPSDGFDEFANVLAYTPGCLIFLGTGRSTDAQCVVNVGAAAVKKLIETHF